jgi:hypothetical protein
MLLHSFRKATRRHRNKPFFMLVVTVAERPNSLLAAFSGAALNSINFLARGRKIVSNGRQSRQRRELPSPLSLRGAF